MIAGFDILAHTSQWEGLPRAVVQALLMQVPAVAFALDGTPEVVIDHTTGRLIPNGNQAEFVSALLGLARDPEARRKLGVMGREHCLDRFDANRMVDEIEALYHRQSSRSGASSVETALSR
jgi:glycosyltransferase involved in cell wall biosynthesis